MLSPESTRLLRYLRDELQVDPEVIDHVERLHADHDEGLPGFLLAMGLITPQQLDQVFAPIPEESFELSALALGEQLEATPAREIAASPPRATRVQPSPTPATRNADALIEAEQAHRLERDEFQRRRRAVLPRLINDPSRYALGPELGKGGMGRVIEAHDHNIDRAVAIKLLIRGADEQLGLQLRFVEEAQITGQLQHPSIVPVYDLGTLADGQLFFAMQRVQGRTLREIISGLRRRAPEVERAFTQARLINAFLQICMAIAYAHDRGVIHRDLKPANIMFGDFGEVLVMDWGLAKLLKREGEAIKSYRDGQRHWATRQGEAIGTPGYMPPELALGQLDEIDERTDVYGLGAMLYEILTLKAPQVGEDAQSVIRRLLKEGITPPRQRTPSRVIPAELEAICMRCLETESDARYPNALALHDALQAYLDSTLERARRAEVVRGQRKLAQEHLRRYHDLDQRAQRLQLDIDTLQLRLAPWEGVERRRGLWDLTKSLEAARRERGEALTQAIHTARQVVEHTDDDPEARAILLTLYWQALQIAEREQDEESVIRYETLLRAFDPEGFGVRLRGDGRLKLETSPPGARVILFSYDCVDRLLTPSAPKLMGLAPVIIEPLEPGRYLVALRAEGQADIFLSLKLDRLASIRRRVRMCPSVLVRPGFVYVPNGRYPVGGDPAAFWSLPADVVEVEGFCIARLPVSCAQYLDFINDLPQEKGLARSPRLFSHGGHLFIREGDRFALPPTDPNGHRWEPSWPVFGVSFEDAEAYCEWRARRDDVPYRLPTDMEWEVAARGADERAFPWGDIWEPTYCKCAHARPGPARLEPSGSFPQDRSPFGLMDLAGGVSDWTASDGVLDWEAHIARGGNWTSLDLYARLASRQAVAPSTVSISIGFRLAYTPR
ncbi:SUMF1/EgtB/PvdO family nonheme iron enzyme [Myxococcota bacterium]|nr:SUMF1/EgtB/PvdO family nonheme iron enzyme [Myxococcota bacterium]MBU1430792.1 SUMF1/EgtB/PvdO family nonheme iron enzyme [Myxococcota bacterium]MBU1900124.1 SUMF1/EgtB/PvdO family nonheme iron enzyme [Myxococcota bacterium]